MPIRSFLIALALLAATTSVAAQEPVSEPRFFLDAIAVEGVRWASERVIVAETRLRPNAEYTESEIRAGAARAARLPFVVRIEPRIEKGAQRGAYRLVLAVTETKPLFFGATLFARNEGEALHELTSGARLFLGRSGMLHGAATNDGQEKRFELGYTQYDLFGRGIYVAATAEYGHDVDQLDDEYLHSSYVERITARVVAGVPLRGNHALRASFTSTPIVSTTTRPLRDTPRDEILLVDRASTGELSWLYDSTDDPLFATRGTRGALTAILRDIPQVSRPRNDPGGPGRQETEIHRSLTGDIRRNWSLAPRHTAAARIGDTWLFRQYGEGGRRDIIHQPFVAAGYAYSIFGPDHPSVLGDLRIEANASFQYVHARFGGLYDTQIRRTFYGAGLLFRNEWGIVRIRFDVGREDQ